MYPVSFSKEGSLVAEKMAPEPEVTIRNYDDGKHIFTLKRSRIGTFEQMMERAFMGASVNPDTHIAHLHYNLRLCHEVTPINRRPWNSDHYWETELVAKQGELVELWMHFLPKDYVRPLGLVYGGNHRKYEGWASHYEAEQNALAEERAEAFRSALPVDTTGVPRRATIARRRASVPPRRASTPYNLETSPFQAATRSTSPYPATSSSYRFQPGVSAYLQLATETPRLPATSYDTLRLSPFTLEPSATRLKGKRRRDTVSPSPGAQEQTLRKKKKEKEESSTPTYRTDVRGYVYLPENKKTKKSQTPGPTRKPWDVRASTWAERDYPYHQSEESSFMGPSDADTLDSYDRGPYIRKPSIDHSQGSYKEQGIMESIEKDLTPPSNLPSVEDQPSSSRWSSTHRSRSWLSSAPMSISSGDRDSRRITQGSPTPPVPSRWGPGINLFEEETEQGTEDQTAVNPEEDATQN